MRARRAALTFALYLTICWGTLLLLARGVAPWTAWAVLALALYVTLPLVAFIVWRGWPFYPGRWFRVLVVRVVLYAQLLLPLVTAGGLAGLAIGAPFGRALDAGRLAAGIVLAIALVALVAGYVGAHRLVVREVEAQVPGLPAAFDGLRIVQISDLHVGPHSSRRFLRAVAETIAALSPDLIAVTGDLVDDRHEDVAAYARAFGSLRAPLGTFVIPGNHDVYAGWGAVHRELRRHAPGIVLVNDAHAVERGGETLAIVGTGDPAARHHWRDPSEDAHGPSAAPDLARAFARVPADATVIAFAHNPALWPALAERGAALTLSGHTHWGQLALPRRGWSLASPFLEHAMGAYRAGDALLYISPGTGYWGIPFRIGASPEVTVVVVRAANGAGAGAGIVVGEARVA